jgi:hypothetical protein
MCQGHKNINIMYKNQCSMTKIGFKLTISPFDYQIFTAPLTEPLRVDYRPLIWSLLSSTDRRTLGGTGSVTNVSIMKALSRTMRTKARYLSLRLCKLRPEVGSQDKLILPLCIRS